MSHWLETRQAARALRRSPGFTLAAVATLALGIGANAAIFSVVRNVLLEPLPFADPERLYVLWETDLHNDSPREGASAPDFFDWREQSSSLELAAIAQSQPNLTGDGTPERLSAAAVSANFLPLLGIEAALGRGFAAEEDRPGGPPVALLADGLWRRRFGADPGVVGKALVLDGVPHAIVGVAPPDLVFPEGSDLWLPLERAITTFRAARGVHNLTVLGRLAAGSTRGAASAAGRRARR